jgi:hypothetical protein
MTLYDKLVKNTNPKEKSLIGNLYTKPKKDIGVNAPHFNVLNAGMIQQADLLFLPNDQGHKYCLVVIDASSKITDAEPLKSKTADAVKQAFEKIYARKILEPPKRIIQVDAGGEFRGAVAKYFSDKGIIMRVAKTGRHRQQAIVERMNSTIGSVLFKRMTAQEAVTGQTSKEWLEDLPELIKIINEKAKTKKKPKLGTEPTCSGDACNLLPEGTKVRVQLDNPIDLITGKLSGRFRAGDIRWNPTVRIVRQVLLKPASPPLYLLDGKFGSKKVEQVAYSRGQLQVIPANEKVDNIPLRGKHNVGKYIIEKILSKYTIGKKTKYKVKWLNYKDPTVESREKLLQDVPDLVKQFDQQHPN